MRMFLSCMLHIVWLTPRNFSLRQHTTYFCFIRQSVSNFSTLCLVIKMKNHKSTLHPVCQVSSSSPPIRTNSPPPLFSYETGSRMLYGIVLTQRKSLIEMRLMDLAHTVQQFNNDQRLCWPFYVGENVC